MTKAFEDRDLGYAAIKRELLDLNKASVKIGIQAGEKNKEGKDLASIGAANEYGSYKRPPRSFMRFTFDTNKGKIDQTIRRLYGRILDRDMGVRSGLGALGEMMQGMIKRRIDTIRQPPLSPTTIERKKSTKPLIDTGQMKNAIRWVIES